MRGIGRAFFAAMLCVYVLHGILLYGDDDVTTT